jgi:hypothetical protein
MLSRKRWTTILRKHLRAKVVAFVAVSSLTRKALCTRPLGKQRKTFSLNLTQASTSQPTSQRGKRNADQQPIISSLKPKRTSSMSPSTALTKHAETQYWLRKSLTPLKMTRPAAKTEAVLFSDQALLLINLIILNNILYQCNRNKILPNILS